MCILSWKESQQTKTESTQAPRNKAVIIGYATAFSEALLSVILSDLYTLSSSHLRPLREKKVPKRA